MKFALFTLLFSLFSAYGQTITKTSLSSLGGTYINTQNNLTLSYNVGEVKIGTLTAGGLQLGSGYYNSLDLSALNINDLNTFGQIEIYPNPTSNILNIKTEEQDGNHTILLRNSDGQELFETNFINSSEINFSLLPSGIYFLTITNNELKSITQKIIKL
jgi:hypothetical protein